MIRIRKPYLDQTRRSSSLLESLGGMALGLLMQSTASFLVISLFFPDLEPLDKTTAVFVLTIVSTGISVTRTYVTRRLFNWLSNKDGVDKQN